MKESSYLKIKTPLDTSVARECRFYLLKLKGEEGLCRDFSYSLDLCSRERLSESDYEDLIGRRVTVQIGFRGLDGTLSTRFINGLVYNIRELGMSRAPLQPLIWRYRVKIGSWMRQLTFAKECRIFQKSTDTGLDIIKDLLVELKMTDFEDRTGAQFPERSYVTCYNESYYRFIVRLMQEEGIRWCFEHTAEKHVLIFMDEAYSFPEISTSQINGVDGFTSFCRRQKHIPVDGCQTMDFDYENPPAKRIVSPGKSGGDGFRNVEYPGHFQSRNDGEVKTQRLKESIESDESVYQGTSTIRMLEAGKRIVVSAPTLEAFDNKPYLIKSLEIDATRETFSNSFTALSPNTPFCFDYADRIEKPEIIGYQTAVVTGADTNNTVHTDDQGRIRVRFHWDRQSPENSGTAFIRNAMPAAGAKRGFVFSPRIGDEVVVGFENGDPDKPIAIGRIYSANQLPAIHPEKAPFRSVIRPNSDKDANSILFDDTKGAENLQFTAKKDMNINIGKDLSIDVDSDLTFLADNLTVTANGNILTGNVMVVSSGPISSKAGDIISNTTGLVVATIAGGIENNQAGGHTINVALGMADSKAGGITVSDAPMILNTTAGNIELTGKAGVKNVALVVAKTATDLIEESSSKSVKQKAGVGIMTTATNETRDFPDSSSSEALLTKNDGITVINE